MRGKEQTTRSREGQGSAFSRDPAWKNKIPGAKARDPEKPRWSRSKASTSRMLFSLQGPHRGARHAEPERPSCTRRVTKGPGATAEPQRAARAQHTLDSAMFTRREGSSPGQSARRSARAPIPSAAGPPVREPGKGRRTRLDAAPLPPAGPEAGRPVEGAFVSPRTPSPGGALCSRPLPRAPGLAGAALDLCGAQGVGPRWGRVAGTRGGAASALWWRRREAGLSLCGLCLSPAALPPPPSPSSPRLWASGPLVT